MRRWYITHTLVVWHPVYRRAAESSHVRQHTKPPAMPFSPGVYASPRPFIESSDITVPELFQWHARENPSIDIFRFYSGNRVEGLTYRDFNKGILRAARLVSSIVGSGSYDRHIIAVFAITGTPAHSHPTSNVCVLRGSFQTLLPIPPSSWALFVQDT